MRGFITFLISFLLFVLYLFFAPSIELLGAKPDFIMISVTVSAFFLRSWYAPIICGLYSGLAVDLLTQPGTFINTGIYLALSVLAFLGAYFIKNKSFFVFACASPILVLIKNFVLMFLLYVMKLSEHFTITTFLRGIPSALYTFVFASIIYFAADKLFSMHFMREKTDEGKRYI